MLAYKGFKISGSSIPMYMEACESIGSVCKPGRNGSVVEVARIVLNIFRSMKEAKAHGLELAREWVDAGEKNRVQQFLVVQVIKVC